MNYMTAKAMSNYPEQIDALLRHFNESDSFTSRTFEEIRDNDPQLPTLSTLRAHHFVKIAEKEQFEITLYVFEVNGYFGKYERSCTEYQAIINGRDIKDAIRTETKTGTRFYYTLDMEGIKRAQGTSVTIKKFIELTERIHELENELAKLRKERQALK